MRRDRLCFSHGAPARAATSPSPVASITTEGTIASRPFFDSTNTAAIDSPSIATPANHVWKRMRTPASTSAAIDTSMNASGSNATEYRTDSGAPQISPHRRHSSTVAGSSLAHCSARRESWPRRSRRQPVDELLAQTRHDLRPFAVVEGEQQVDEPDGGQAAQRARLLEQPRRRAPPRRRDRRRDPRRAPADDQHVGAADDRDLASRLMKRIHAACCRTMRGDAEQDRLDADREGTARWKWWGPYLPARQWGTVREDYSAGGTAWDYFPHEHARSARLPLG